MTQPTESQTYTAFPNQLFDDLVQGKIDNMMFNILVWLYRRANWKSGIAVRASSQQIRAELWGGWTYEKNPPSERTVQEKLRRLADMGYIVSHHTAGRRGTYSISINNYPALTPAGEEIILRPTITKSLDEVLVASCGDNGGESSGESSADPAVSLPRTHSTTLDSPSLHSTEDQPRVSKGVSENGSLRSPSLDHSRDSKTEPVPEVWERYKELKEAGWIDLINTLIPALGDSEGADRELGACLQLKDAGYTPENVSSLWNYNLSHKRGTKLEFYSLAQVVKAIESNDPRSIYAQMLKCQANPCRKCPPQVPPPPSQDEYVGVSAGSGEAFEDENMSPCGLLYTDRNCMCQLPERPIVITHPNGNGHVKLVDMVAEPRQAFAIEEDRG